MTKKITFFSEDICEIQSAFWNICYNKEINGLSENDKRVYNKLTEIYNQLYCSDDKQIILEDEDRRGYNA